MPNQKNRIIIDTNLWVSFLLTKRLSQLDTIIANKEVTLLFSTELLKEFTDVTQRSKFKNYFSLKDIASLLQKISSRALFVSVKSKVIACRDAKDNFLLALAVDGEATHLITGDKDLLVLEKYRKTQIVTIAAYLSEAR